MDETAAMDDDLTYAMEEISSQDIGDDSFSAQDDSSLTPLGPHSSKRRAYSVVEKLAHVKRVNNGERPSKVARDIGVPISTLRGWVKTEAKLCSVVTGIFGDQNHVITRKKLRPGDFNSIDLAVYQWVRSQLSVGERLTREAVRQYAQELARRISVQTGENCSFTGCNSWFYRWRKRYGLEVHGIDRELQLIQGTPLDPSQGLPDESILQGVSPPFPHPPFLQLERAESAELKDAGEWGTAPRLASPGESSVSGATDLTASGAPQGDLGFRSSQSGGLRLLSDPGSPQTTSLKDRQERLSAGSTHEEDEDVESSHMASQTCARNELLQDWSSSSGGSPCSLHRDGDSEDDDDAEDKEGDDDGNVVPVLEEVAMVVEALGLKPVQVYCGCSMVHFWKMVPELLADSGVDPTKFIVNCKSSVFLSVNQNSSHRVGVLAVGSDQSEDAQCLSTPEVTYQYHPTATLTFQIFRHWFHTQFVPEVQNHLCEWGLAPKALLLVDGGSVSCLPCRHMELVSQDRQVRVLFLDAQVLWQYHPFLATAPVDLRRHYHSHLLEEARGQGQITPTDYLQSITLTNMLLRLVKAWRAICPTSDLGTQKRGHMVK